MVSVTNSFINRVYSSCSDDKKRQLLKYFKTKDFITIVYKNR